MIPGCGNGFSHALTKWPASPTGVDDVRAFGRGIINTLDKIIVGRISRRIEGFQGHELHTPRHADYACAVIADGANDTGNMRSMGVIIVRIARPSTRVDSMDVVSIAISVVVDVVSGNFTRISPHIRSKVLMRISDAGVDHGHDHVVGVGLLVPALRRVNVGVGCTAILASIVEVPERAVGVLGVIWIRNCEVPNISGLGICDLTAVLIVGDCLGNRRDLDISNVRVGPQDASAKLRVQRTDVWNRRFYQNAV